MPPLIRSHWLGILLLLFLSPAFAPAQDTANIVVDSLKVHYFVDSLKIHYFNETDFINHDLDFHQIDTSLKGFQKFNPIHKTGEYYADLGSIGLASRNIVFSPSPIFGFNLGIHSFDKYLYKHENIPYFVNPIPYTDIFYVMGRYREQNFSILHSQNIGDNLTLAAKFQIVSAAGDFQRQQANNSSFFFTSGYFTNNRRYGVIASYVTNSFKVEENGGIFNDSTFEIGTESDTKRIPVYLLEAQNTWKEAAVSLNQYYFLSKKELTETDSTPLKNIQKVFSPGRISHSFHYTRNKLMYEDNNPDTLFYPAFYFDSSYTKDQLNYQQLDNTLTWTNSVLKTSPFVLSMSVKHLYGKYMDYERDSLLFDQSINQLIYKGSITIRPIPSLSIYGEANLINGDYNNGDYRFFAFASKDFIHKSGKRSQVLLKAEYSQQKPAWFYQHYISNHFIWENDFSKTGTFNTSLEIKRHDLQFKFNFYTVSDFVYLGIDTLPKQAQKDVNIMNGIVHYYNRFHKFDIDVGAVYHFVSDPDIIRIPKIMGTFSMYFVQDLFKKALRTQLGFDLYYNAKYRADAYMPATRSFFIQDDTQLDQLFVADAVFKFQVKTARFFLKYIHVNSLLGKRNYFRTPHYPIQEASFKFGISWIFHD